MNKLLFLVPLVLIYLGFLFGDNHGKNKAENECKANVIIQTKEVIKIQNATQQTVIKAKKIAKSNALIARDELIDKL